ncbi:helix-turn-helix domain-containing protein [Parabacteroides sp. OttesenSCG-928-O15]|nr:helix-turn-helix domain-containing protein [Parabacteroides sp. OttesenSCG-928-O15]
MNTSNKITLLTTLLALLLMASASAQNKIAPQDSIRIDSLSRQAGLTGLDFYRAGVYTEALENFLLALSLQKELNNPRLLFGTYENICNSYFYVGDYAMIKQYASEAIEFARAQKNQKSEAWFMVHLADACKRSQEIQEAEQHYNQAFGIYQQIGDSMQMAIILNNKASMYGMDSPKKLASFQEAARLFEAMPADATTWNRLSHLYANIGDWYKHNGDLQEAEAYFQKAIEAVKASGSHMQAIYLYSHLAENYLELNNHNRAKQLALQTVDLINTHVGANHTFDIALKILGKIYASENNYKEAYNSLLKWSAVNDSLQKHNKEEELNRIKQRYEYESYRQEEVNKQNLELERKKASIATMRISLIGLTTACLLLIIIGTLIYLYSRKLKAKNRELYLQIKDQDRLVSKVEERELAILAAQPDSESSKNTKLYLALKELMEKEQLYKQADINRKKIATLLGTNEKYLYDAVKENTDCSFGDYINRLRIRHARQLLTGDEHLTIDDIATYSGFGSKVTFYRNFREAYKLSPTEYRRLAMEEKVEKN